MDSLAFASRQHHPTIQVCLGVMAVRMLMSGLQELTADATRIELTRRNAAVL